MCCGFSAPFVSYFAFLLFFAQLKPQVGRGVRGVLSLTVVFKATANLFWGNSPALKLSSRKSAVSDGFTPLKWTFFPVTIAVCLIQGNRPSFFFFFLPKFASVYCIEGACLMSVHVSESSSVWWKWYQTARNYKTEYIACCDHCKVALSVPVWGELQTLNFWKCQNVVTSAISVGGDGWWNRGAG